MQYYVPQTPDDIKILKPMSRGAVSTEAEMFLAEALNHSNTDIAPPDGFPAPMGFLDAMGLFHANLATPSSNRVKFSLRSGDSARLLFFSDNSKLLSFTPKGSELSAFLPFALEGNTRPNGDPLNPSCQARNDIEVWRHQLALIPQLHLDEDCEDVDPDHFIPTWAPHRIMSDCDSTQLGQWLALGLRAFCARHNVEIEPGSPSIQITSRLVDRQGELSNLGVSWVFSHEDRARLSGEIAQFLIHLFALASSPACPVPPERQVRLRPPLVKSAHHYQLERATITHSFDSKPIESSHDALQAIAQWEAATKTLQAA